MQTMTRGPFSGAFIHQLERLFHQGTVTGLTEGELLDRFVTGNDETAFEVLIARHGPMVLGVCQRLLRDPHDVDDAFQATFLVLVRRAGTLRRQDLLGNWLYGVAHRVALRARSVSARRLARAPFGQEFVERIGSGEAGRGGSESPGLDPEPAAWLHEEIRRLPEKYRTVILLCYLEGLSHEQAAARLACPIGTVKGRLARARDLLRHRLIRRGIALTASAIAAHLAESNIRAAVPDALRYATLQAARAVATGSILASSSLTLPVAALTNGVTRAMFTTKARILAIPLLIAGLVTSGAVIGSAQQPASQEPAAPRVAAVSPVVDEDENASEPSQDQGIPQGKAKADALDPVEMEPKTAAQLLAEGQKVAQELFDYLASEKSEMRLGDAHMLHRLSLRMLSTGRDLAADDRARIEAYEAHRDRMKKLADRLGQGGRRKKGGSNESNKEVAALAKYERDAEILLERARKDQPEKIAAERRPGGEPPKVAAKPEPAEKASAEPKPAEQARAARREKLAEVEAEGQAHGGDDSEQKPTPELVERRRKIQMTYNRMEIARITGAVEGQQAQDPKDQEILKKLEQPLILSIGHQTRLDDLFKHLRSVLRDAQSRTIPVYVDAGGLEEAGVSLDTPIPMNIEGLPTKVALRLLLRKLGLAYCIRDGVLIISSVQGIRDELMEVASEVLGSQPNGLQMLNMYGVMGGMGGGMGGMGGMMGGMGGGMGGMMGGMGGGGMR